MAELSLQERLQPVLLDRLTDDEPEKQLESREQRVVSLAKLRGLVLRDLSWLLNTVQLGATQDLTNYPFVARSVLNYGIPGLAGGSVAQLGTTEMEDTIKEAILRFEPRLIPNSVKVTLREESLDEQAHNTITLAIEAELWCEPLPLQMFMKTEIDLEVGTTRVVEEAEAGRSADRASRR